ncbi:acyl-CoA thioesterase [Paraconexibacter sp.]|uniref:acyl-CoA thioesterase n=1 Tax=Paraconexibacter sp. TaxID=2949640 RepID=UPI0035659E61
MPSRPGYAHVTQVPTRWADNDIYGHVNNVQHYAFFDTAINRWLIEEGGLDIHGGDVIGLCAESHCTYSGPFAYPDVIDVAMRVGHLGRSSVRYELALYREEDEASVAEGWFVHVFVDRETRRSAGMPDRLRDALSRLQVPATEEASS